MVNVRRPEYLPSSKRRSRGDKDYSIRHVVLVIISAVVGIVLIVASCSLSPYSAGKEKSFSPATTTQTTRGERSFTDDEQTAKNRDEEKIYGSEDYQMETVPSHDIITVPVLVPHTMKDLAGLSDSSGDTSKHRSASITLPVRQLSIQEMMNPEFNNAQEKPLVLTGWEKYQRSTTKGIDDTFASSMEETSFLSEFGNYTHYLKNEFVQPLKDNRGINCIATASSILELMRMKSKSSILGDSSSNTLDSKNDDLGNHLLFFTNDLESPDFFQVLKKKYTVPSPLHYGSTENSSNSNDVKKSFHVFSAMMKGSFHGFHKHDDAHITLIHGRKMWWFLPPSTTTPSKENPCLFLMDKQRNALPKETLSVIQQPGDTIFVPKKWYHATCALDDWTVAVGMQRGSPHKYEQKFKPLPQPFVQRIGQGSDESKITIDGQLHPMPWSHGNAFQKRIAECGVSLDWNDPKSWTWFEGDLNQYYNKLVESDSKRNPKDIKSYAVHRWMGKSGSTLTHYELIYNTIEQFIYDSQQLSLHLLDAGCGLGAGLMWFETYGPKSWELVGHTISTAQVDFIQKLPSHEFHAELKSYDDLGKYNEEGAPFDVIYSIEAFIHSPDERHTLKNWSDALSDRGIIVIIDDFLSVGVDKNADDIQLFSKSWMGNVLQTTSSLSDIAEKYNLELIVDRDLASEYQIIKHNYRNKIPDIRPTENKNHQGWLGAGMRQRLTVEGKLTYRMIVFQKKSPESTSSTLSSRATSSQCSSIPTVEDKDSPLLNFEPLVAEHKTGKGKNGGETQKCISGWYCCGKGDELWETLDSKRTHNTAYLKLDKSLFGNYLDKIAEHLNQFYPQLPLDAKGKFLDIGGTGR